MLFDRMYSFYLFFQSPQEARFYFCEVFDLVSIIFCKTYILISKG